MELIHKTAINILDVSYLLRTRLKDLLRYASSESDEETLKRRCVSNHFLLAACVIVAASYVIDSSTNDTVSWVILSYVSVSYHILPGDWYEASEPEIKFPFLSFSE